MGIKYISPFYEFANGTIDIREIGKLKIDHYDNMFVLRAYSKNDLKNYLVQFKYSDKKSAQAVWKELTQRMVKYDKYRGSR